jgi:hypothetical protein
MVASGSLFLLCLSASSYHCRHVKPSSACSGPRREDRITRSLSARSTDSEGQIDDGVNILTSDIRQLQWEEKYLLVKQFKEREGHCDVPQLHKEDGANLGVWVSHQRQLKKKETLDPDRQKILSEFGFEWVLREKRANVPWEEIFSLLKQFKMREGHCNVPQSHTEDGANLGAWVNHQRRLKKTGALDPEKKKRLEEIDIEWVLRERRANVPWEEIFSLLKQFKMREGHCNVPQLHTEDGANLGHWVNNQRQLKKKETLDPEKKKRLEEIDIEWVLVERRASVSWEDIVSLLKQFKMREGHCNVPLSHKEDGSNLGAWVSTQRHLKKKEKLDPDRQKILEAIGFEWVLVERRANAPWEDIFSL